MTNLLKLPKSAARARAASRQGRVLRRTPRILALASRLTILADEALPRPNNRSVGHPGIVLLEAAAELGSAFAAWRLADCYEHGVRVRRDPKVANAWYLRAAHLGSAQAMTALGVRDWKRGRHASAVKYYRRAARMGEPFAQRNLALTLLEKRTRAANQEGLAWLKRAARAGQAGAMYRLSLELAAVSGKSSKRKELAIRWLKKAARAGSKDAVQLLRSRGSLN
jgi:TPR repeat protein